MKMRLQDPTGWGRGAIEVEMKMRLQGPKGGAVVQLRWK